MHRIASVVLFALAALLIMASSAPAVIMALTPLKAFIGEGQYIVVAKVEKVYADKPAMVLTVAEDLKGKAPFRRLPVLLTGDEDAKKDNHTEQLLKRVADDIPVVMFVHFNKASKKYHSFAYTNGTWFQLLGHKTGEETVTWTFAHCEPYLRRTFKGTTAELKDVVMDAIAGKKKAPEPNSKESPGFGPEIKR